MQIRSARGDDAEAACDVLRRSIAELCSIDHRGDAGVLAAWLANKTPQNVAAWIARPGTHVLLAVDGETVLAVGAVTGVGEILLNYVSPDARFRGVSRALLAALEDKARELGCETCTLTSTETARRFYLSAGYIEQGPPRRSFGTDAGYPLKKSLSGAPRTG